MEATLSIKDAKGNVIDAEAVTLEDGEKYMSISMENLFKAVEDRLDKSPVVINQPRLS